MATTTAARGVRIAARDQSAPVALAVSELSRYLALIAPGVPIALAPDTGYFDPAAALCLGTFAAFGDAQQSWPNVADPTLDDAILIDVVGGAGIIAGSNPRSVLLAGYRYLTALGCRWVRPGPDGEILPQIDLGASTVRIAEAAAYRHRGICIEGAVSFEHVRDLLDWMPKLGLNAYFMQFREAYTFFERWYSHRGNPTLPAEQFSVERARELKGLLAGEIARRGLVYHDVGHGWTCDPLGMPGLGWAYPPPPVPPGAEQYLAEVNGERALWHGIPLNTQICFSNGAGRELVLGAIVDYARTHREVDIIHFWLGDGWNNHCECAGCRGPRPADWYLRLLNELDARLTAAGLPTRIVFLLYFDLLWPPVTERLRMPERFLLMFAPITRTYSAAYATDPAAPVPDLPPFVLNQITLPRDVGANVAFLRAWQALFRGDSFDFDYHLMWDHYRDPGGMANAAVLHEDIQGLAALGLNGLISCQVQRAFFPHGLAMTILGRTLWDRSLSFRAIAEDHFAALFGDDGAACLEYCEALSRAFNPPYLRGERPRHDPETVATCATIPALLAAFRPTIGRNLAASTGARAQSWRYLDHHAALCLTLAEALGQRAAGDDDAARAAWDATARYVQENEPEVQIGLDGYEFQHTLARLFARADEPQTVGLP
jgi:hypothetical protein